MKDWHEMEIKTSLRAQASQENCDGEPYDTMIRAADRIDEGEKLQPTTADKPVEYGELLEYVADFRENENKRALNIDQFRIDVDTLLFSLVTDIKTLQAENEGLREALTGLLNMSDYCTAEEGERIRNKARAALKGESDEQD